MVNQIGPRPRKWLLVASVVLFSVLGVGAILVGLRWGLASQLTSHVIDRIVEVSGLSRNLVRGVVLLGMLPLILSIWEVFSLRILRRRNRGRWRVLGAHGVLVVYLALFSFALFAASRGNYFSHFEGQATKWYAVTPEGVRFFDEPGFDPKYGLELHPATPEIVSQFERARQGRAPERIVVERIDEVDFFDRITGEPLVWYFADRNGDIELYSAPGVHPIYGESLKPINREAIDLFRSQLARRPRPSSSPEPRSSSSGTGEVGGPQPPRARSSGPPKVAIVGVGDDDMAPLVQDLLSESLSDLPLGELEIAGGSLGLKEILQRYDWSPPLSAVAEVLEGDGYSYLVLAEASWTGDRELRFFGRRDIANQWRVRVDAYALPEREAIGPGWGREVETTSRNATEKLTQLLAPIASEVGPILKP